jgi:nucleotide-binding universal stress UspA family protein
VLVERSTRASLVVVGRHGAGFHPWLGNVAQAVVHHAACPVVVVPGGPAPAVNGPILVGVDGSPEAAQAVRWAHAEADRRSLPLLALLAWPLLEQLAHRRPGDLELPYDEEQARRSLDHALRAALGSDAESVGQRTVGALATDALLEHARRSTLTVVGARGLGGFEGLLVGSVSQRLVQSAPTPVVVVRGPLGP